MIDGEAVILGVDGVSDFNALHSRKHDHEAQLYAFDILAMGGDDVRGEIVPDLFRAACFKGVREDLQTSPRSHPPSRTSRAM
ncbi:hypothetical protein [Bradyrhizobium sp. CCBAU 65884]|uniref:hypothetical protein n=1 Tax=Bradyrhizobium sp. CCBAU 65884 TaxID=722477 RepID=UPI0023069AF7|nr:hypothetical protein [Bradyrhizobium sp. CCBAU 65884]